MKKLMIRTAFVLFAATVIISCKCSKNATSKMMTETTWQLARVNGQAVNPSDYSSKGVPTVMFKDGQASGHGGCNSYSGKYTLKEDGTLEMGPVIATKMACTPGMDGEKQYFEAFNKVNKAKTEGSSLILLEGDTELLAYTKK